MNDATNTLMELDGILASNEAKIVAQSTETAKEPNYSLTGLNIQGSVSLEKIITAVRNFRNGTHRPDVDRPRMSILLNGVPGGGKTAFARHLARKVGAQLKCYRASDLLSSWVGESEKNLATAFRTAAEENAILMIDEVDSFLMSREAATHQWVVIRSILKPYCNCSCSLLPFR